MDNIVAKIRSCLISTKGMVTLRQLDDDYCTLLGERIPYAQFGYNRLDEFIKSIPSLILTKSPDGKLLVDARVSDKSAHISTMVRKQKSLPPKKKPTKHLLHNKYRQQSTHITTKWRPKNVTSSKQQQKQAPPPRPSMVTHNQFVNSPVYNNKPTVPSKIVIPKHSKENNVAAVVVVNNNNNNNNDSRCSPLASTKKRISQLMAHIDLERDSGNSSPTDFVPPPPPSSTIQPQPSVNKVIIAESTPVEFQRTGNPIEDLKNFAQFYRLGDVEISYKEEKVKSNRSIMYHCKIKIGQQIFSSYPNDFHDKTSAGKFAAQKALDDLYPKYSRRKSLLISSNEDVLERIPPMLVKHTNALWTSQLEADYIDRYKEQLPSNWLQIVDSSQFVSIEKCLGGYVLKYCNPDDDFQKGKKWEANLSLCDVSVPCNTVDFGDNERLVALITSVMSINEIWCQHIENGEYEEFTRMIERMGNYYNSYKDNLLPNKINFNNFYVAYNDANWWRIRVLGMSKDKDGYINCIMIDYGDEVDVPAKSIYQLQRQFATIPAQAFVCRLAGLEDLYEASLHSEYLSSLLGDIVIVEIGSYEFPDENVLSFPVVMYDYETEESLNEAIISKLTIESASPLVDDNMVHKIYVSNIEKNGDVYVQIHTPGYHSLQKLMENLESSINDNQRLDLIEPVTSATSSNRLYLVKYKVTGRWLRTSIIDWSPKGDLAQIYFIDYGNTDVINVKNEIIYPLEKLSDVINQYPRQAVKVRILIDYVPSEFIDMATKLMPSDQLIVMKTVRYDNEKVRWVEFFKRSSDGGLFCINKSITMEAELKKDVANNNEKGAKKRLLSLVHFNDTIKNVPSGGRLKKPPLPSKEDFFNVKIPFAVNPWNFFVQPLSSIKELNKLMADMQERYKNIQYSPLTIDEIIPGNIYASKHDDSRWYRTSVLKVIHPCSISVFYCDFGYYTSLTLQQLIPLDVEFMELPYQALKAKLSGIKPVQSKWTVEDCETFKRLVMNKAFSSVVHNIEKDELYKSDLILKLTLVDTSTKDDIKIHEILVERGIAIYV